MRNRRTREEKNQLQRHRYHAARIAGIDVYTAMRIRGNAVEWCKAMQAAGQDHRAHGDLAKHWGDWAL